MWTVNLPRNCFDFSCTAALAALCRSRHLRQYEMKAQERAIREQARRAKDDARLSGQIAKNQKKAAEVDGQMADLATAPASRRCLLD